MKNIYAANWKMNKTPQETSAYFTEFNSLFSSTDLDKDILFFLPSTSLYLKEDCLQKRSYGWGGQNCFFEDRGAYTGEISPQTLKEMSVEYCLVGHSERRTLFCEKNEFIEKKCKALLRHNISPLLCVGESLEERKAGQSVKVVLNQLQTALGKTQDKIIVAYEPVWAIGTGEVATPQMVQEVHLEVRKFLNSHYGQTKGESTPILYGGSVKPENASELIQQSEVNGFLVGGASLDPGIFAQLIQVSEGH